MIEIVIGTVKTVVAIIAAVKTVRISKIMEMCAIHATTPGIIPTAIYATVIVDPTK